MHAVAADVATVEEMLELADKASSCCQCWFMVHIIGKFRCLA